jgi:signal transduction histidine kinase
MTNDTITSAASATTKTDDPIMQSEIEERIINWLETHGISDGWKLASDLLDAGITINELNEISKIINSRSRSLKGTDMTGGDEVDEVDDDDRDNNGNAKNLEDILSWLTTSIKVDHLLYEIKSSTVRISDLVSAVKSYSYMDRAPLQEVDIHEGLESTLTILQYKLRKAGINVIREFDPNLQKINAYGNELNQVWTNLIDNAIDGIGKDGTISIRTKNEGNDHVLVEIADNGKQGIPEDIKSHIFEPFFTTKEQGKGTGIGLSISHRIVTETHRGDIRVYSVPGETRFQVRLPIIYKEGLEKRYWSWVKPMDYQAKS